MDTTYKVNDEVIVKGKGEGEGDSRNGTIVEVNTISEDGGVQTYKVKFKNNLEEDVNEEDIEKVVNEEVTENFGESTGDTIDTHKQSEDLKGAIETITKTEDSDKTTVTVVMKKPTLGLGGGKSRNQKKRGGKRTSLKKSKGKKSRGGSLAFSEYKGGKRKSRGNAKKGGKRKSRGKAKK